MTKFIVLGLILGSLISGNPSSADVKKKITGRSEHQVKENAFKEGKKYPVTPIKCSQRCSQWWE